LRRGPRDAYNRSRKCIYGGVGHTNFPIGSPIKVARSRATNGVLLAPGESRLTPASSGSGRAARPAAIGEMLITRQDPPDSPSTASSGSRVQANPHFVRRSPRSTRAKDLRANPPYPPSITHERLPMSRRLVPGAPGVFSTTLPILVVAAPMFGVGRRENRNFRWLLSTTGGRPLPLTSAS
jgi:hypothetical protein